MKKKKLRIDLANILEEKNLTIKELAENISCEESILKDFAKGNTSQLDLDSLEKITNDLEIEQIDDLMTFEGDFI